MTFLNLPRKPLSAAEVSQNRARRLRAKDAMAWYFAGEQKLRLGLEEKHGVTFEQDDDGHYFVDDTQTLGAFDVENFTDSQRAQYDNLRAVVEEMISRASPLSILSRPATTKTVKVTRWKQTI